VRRSGFDGLDYIGQTGTGTMTLRKRITMLRGVYAREMPYRDPHTAAPGLWALRQTSSTDFETSTCPVAGTTAWRKALEAVAIASYRQEHGTSPTLNFGRMPRGYRMSSGNNARLVAACRRFRGGPCDEPNEAHEPGIAPLAPLDGDVTSSRWCGHRWSAWQPLNRVCIAGLDDAATGLYRLAGRNGDGLLYVGEGRLRSRLGAHLAKLGVETPQGRVLSDAAPLRYSTTRNVEWLRHQRLELETDLIAAHTLGRGVPPPAQFIG
jgi:hypothetical protein